ncbi:PREDICTED: uncharacterized protein LOC105971187 [Erythranthe guttata]|uniref:uncharacterized protein LOC105971187 n=1 Tax=Erythranthe guttata TaxID=4155 RepID=UPI00064DDD9D|nr:PREDICTED: uncharacterized protein LOC105971187 [Erythranthe guttata]|eukprot:XP_012851492.1 PREDICTED: uncharacterized protein LOC105971187 [Erythranthe guttata]
MSTDDLLPTKSSSSSPTPIITDLYTIHHSDSPSTILVTPLLTGDNYGSWSRAVTMALRAKNKLGFVDGSLPIPTEKSDISNWERCNDLVGSWILNSVSPEIRPSILYAETAAQIWTDLKDRFSQSNAPKIYQLKQSISSLKQESMSVSLYFTQLKSLWDELGSIIHITPCICEEKQQEINILTTPTVDAAALQASKPPFRPSGKRQRPFCDHCNKHGHTLATCYQLHGFPDKHVKKSVPPPSNSTLMASSLTHEQYNKLLTLLAKEETSGPSVHLAGPINEEDDWSG